jgi:hypothetical protein
MAEDLDDYRRIFNRSDDLQSAVATFMSMSKTRLSGQAQLMRGVSPWARA